MKKTNDVIGNLSTIITICHSRFDRLIKNERMCSPEAGSCVTVCVLDMACRLALAEFNESRLSLFLSLSLSLSLSLCLPPSLSLSHHGWNSSTITCRAWAAGHMLSPSIHQLSALPSPPARQGGRTSWLTPTQSAGARTRAEDVSWGGLGGGLGGGGVRWLSMPRESSLS